MKSATNLSIGNLSRDSGVLVMDGQSSRGHSRNASNATYCSNDSQYYGPAKSAPSIRINSKALFILLATILSLLALLSYAYLPLLVKHLIQSIINIKPDAEFYDFWKESSEPTEVGIYFFHIENPWAVENGLENLRVREMGKYYFK